MTRTTKRLAPLFAVVVTLIAAGPAAAANWAPADSAPIHPGVNTTTEGGSCTANFVFTNGSDVLIGQAAHCSSTGEATETDGCTSKSLPLGTPVTVDGASKPGKLVYNSWLTMQALGEKDADTCAYNDLALVELDPADVDRVNPSIPHYGGPTGVATAGIAAGDPVVSYGNSSLRQGIALLSPKRGISLGDQGGGWSHMVATLTPGVPGDSGSAFLTGDGKALGTLSTLALAPIPGSNGVGDIAKEVAYLGAHSDLGAQLALGTEPFKARLIPIGIDGLP